MNLQEYKLHQGIKFWNVIFTIFFLFLNFFFFLILKKSQISIINISLFDFVIISLSVWRSVRLFVYDNITLFLREFFLDLKIENDKYEFFESKNSFKATIYKLLLCPWCFGVWSASILTFIYFFAPDFKIFYYILASSSVASFLQVYSNLLGWKAESKKQEAQNFKK